MKTFSRRFNGAELLKINNKRSERKGEKHSRKKAIYKGNALALKWIHCHGFSAFRCLLFFLLFNAQNTLEYRFSEQHKRCLLNGFLLQQHINVITALSESSVHFFLYLGCYVKSVFRQRHILVSHLNSVEFITVDFSFSANFRWIYEGHREHIK